MQNTQIRVRFAPSPTGLLHIGGLRTALYNYLFARQQGGSVVLRIEDTDRSRYVEEAEEDILTSLKWAGLSFDEGPDVGGAHEPYYQSLRKDHYEKYASQLVDSGAAYLAFDSTEEIEMMRQRFREQGVESMPYGVRSRMEMKNSLSLTDAAVEELKASGVPYVVRLLVPDEVEITFHDLVRGDVTFSSQQLDDQVLLKSDGLPTYHLANVVDDHLMGITHVIRGEEWLPSTPKHVLLYKALGWDPPVMAHLPLILSPTGGKLSKRKADKMGIPVSVRQYIEQGYEPEALLNFLALLGWHPGNDTELFTLDALVNEFDISRVGSSGVQFDLEKLKWFNEQYLRAKSPAEIATRAARDVAEAGFDVDLEYLERVSGLVRERISFVHDIASMTYLFVDPMSFDKKAVSKRWTDDAVVLLGTVVDALDQVENDEWVADKLHDVVERVVTQEGLRIGKIMPQLRLATSGASSGPDLFPTLEILGKTVVCRRIRNAPDLIAGLQQSESD